MGIGCAAYGCSQVSSSKEAKSKNISFHQFPHKDPMLMKQWFLFVRRAHFKPSRNSRLCSLHFTESCFVYQNFTNIRQIKRDAVPTIFNEEGYSKRKIRQFDLKEKKVQNCCSAVPSENYTDHISSKQKILKNKVKKEVEEQEGAIFKPSKILKPSEKKAFANRQDKRHFKTFDKTCITKEAKNKVHETVLQDGKIYLIKRKSLPKSDSIPDSPLNMSRTIGHSKVASPTKHTELIQDENVNMEHFSYSKLVSEIDKVEKPNAWWTVSSIPTYVICIKWDNTLNIVCKVAVYKDLMIKVFLGMKETRLPNMQTKTVENVEDLSQLLSRLEKVLQLRQEIEKTREECFRED